MAVRDRTEGRDRARELRKALDRTGFHPDVVAEAVSDGVGGEPVISFFVHHEPTFDRDEVRRHQSVLVLTPTRLLFTHTDEHAGDDLLPEPYTSTTAEAVSLTSVKSVVVTRMIAESSKGAGAPAEALVTIGWGGVNRLDLEPASCNDPHCEADHGYTGAMSSDDFNLRVSARADGPDAVDGLLSFAKALSASTRG
jgi:hypothetical protein